MVSVIAAGLFNAVAFAGASFLFSKVDHKGYSSDMKRHDKAMEKLAAAKEKFYETEQKRYDKFKQRKEELLETNEDIEETNRALDKYKKAMRRASIVQGGIRFNSEPRLEQFYKPSEEMEKYKYLFIAVLASSSVFGLVLSRYY